MVALNDVLRQLYERLEFRPVVTIDGAVHGEHSVHGRMYALKHGVTLVTIRSRTDFHMSKDGLQLVNVFFSNSGPWSECSISGGPKILMMRSIMTRATVSADLFGIGVNTANRVR